MVAYHWISVTDKIELTQVELPAAVHCIDSDIVLSLFYISTIYETTLSVTEILSIKTGGP